MGIDALLLHGGGGQRPPKGSAVGAAEGAAEVTAESAALRAAGAPGGGSGGGGRGRLSQQAHDQHDQVARELERRQMRPLAASAACSFQYALNAPGFGYSSRLRALLQSGCAVVHIEHSSSVRSHGSELACALLLAWAKRRAVRGGSWPAWT